MRDRSAKTCQRGILLGKWPDLGEPQLACFRVADDPIRLLLNALCWHTLLAYLFSRERVRAAYSRTRCAANRIGHHGALGLNLLVASLREALFLIYRAKPGSTP